MNDKKISGLILSAGLSRRIGKFKPMMEINGISFIHSVITKLSKVCDSIIVVTGYKSGKLVSHINDLKDQAALSKVKIIFNKEYKNGMFSSLVKGIENCRQADWVLYHFVDQPAVPQSFYFDFIKEIDDNYDWIQPENNAGKGHPVIFNKRVMDLILNSDIHSNLKTISGGNKIKKKYWYCGAGEISKDVDTLADYSELVNKEIK